MIPRFKNRKIVHSTHVQFFTARDFKASVICSLAKFERYRKLKKAELAKFEHRKLKEFERFLVWYANTGGLIEDKDFEKVLEKF